MSEISKNKRKNFKEKDKQKKVIYVKKKSDEEKPSNKSSIQTQNEVLNPLQTFSKNVLLAIYSPDYFNFLDVLSLTQEYPDCFSLKKIPPTLLFKSNKNNKTGLINPKKTRGDKTKFTEKRPKVEKKYEKIEKSNEVPEWYASENKNINQVNKEIQEWKIKLENEELKIQEEIKDSYKVEDFSKIDELMELKFKNTEIQREYEEEVEEEDIPDHQHFNDEDDQKEENPEWGDVDIDEIKNYQIPEPKHFSKAKEQKKSIEEVAEDLNLRQANFKFIDEEEMKTSFKEEFNREFPAIGEKGNEKKSGSKTSKNNINSLLGISNIDPFKLKMETIPSNNEKAQSQPNKPPPGIEKQTEVKPQIPMEKLLSRIFPPMAKYNQFLIFSTFSSKFKFDNQVEAWYYKDPFDQIQGPFNSQNMDIWNTQGYFPPNLNISWFQCQQFVILERFRNSPEMIYKLAQIYSSKVIKIDDKVIDDYLDAEKRTSVEKTQFNQNFEFSSILQTNASKNSEPMFNIQLNVNQNVYNNQINTHPTNRNSIESIFSMANNFKPNQKSFGFDNVQNFPQNSFQVNEKNKLHASSPIKEDFNSKLHQEGESLDLISSLSQIKTFDEKVVDLTAKDIKMMLGIGGKSNKETQNKPQTSNSKAKQIQNLKEFEILKEDFPHLSDYNKKPKNK